MRSNVTVTFNVIPLAFIMIVLGFWLGATAALCALVGSAFTILGVLVQQQLESNKHE